MKKPARLSANKKMKIAIVVALLLGAVAFAQDQPAKDQPAKSQPNQDQASQNQAAQDQPAPDQTNKDQADKDQANKDQDAQEHPAQDQASKDQVPRDQSKAAQPRASCGPASVQFEVRSEKKHPIAQPAADKALVYVVENLRAGCFLCDTTTKIGLDGTWIGATKGNSYLSFSLDPGEHHLCANLQSEPSGSDTTGLASFIADAGRTYYFRVRLTDQNNSGKGGVQWAVDLDPLDSDQGRFLIDSYESSSYHKKK